MNRSEIMLQNLDPASQTCVEIGALDKPIVPASERVFYVDHLDTQALREKYKDDPGVCADKIVDVCGVWGGKTLDEITPPVDFIVASHVVEHVPDLISWLQELAAVLKPGGEIRLAIPDRRYTFDIQRQPSSVADVVAAYAVKARVPQPAQVADFTLNMADVDCKAVWDGEVPTLSPGYVTDVALRLTREAAVGKYHDVHCWVFTPASFCELMETLVRMGLMGLRCSMFADTQRNTFEFFVGLQSCADAETAAESWRAIAADLRAREAEQQAREQQEAFLRDPRWLEAQAQLALVAAERDAAKAQAAAVARTVDEVRASTSWRLTAPLRALRSFFRS